MELQDERSVNVEQKKLSKEYTYKNTVVLTADIQYPHFSGLAPKAQRRINRFYEHTARSYLSYAERQLFRIAKMSFDYAQGEGYPFNAYSAVMNTVPTLLTDSLISLYFDQYEFTGGAHGNTLRYADTWNARTGHIKELGELFRTGASYRRILIDSVAAIAAAQMSTGAVAYFEDYRKLVKSQFRASNFYLTDAGLSVFYQQYAIGPYAIGIPVFDIPYDSLKKNLALQK